MRALTSAPSPHVMSWKLDAAGMARTSLSCTRLKATEAEPAELSAEDRAWAEEHGVPPTELVELACRSMKCVAALSDEWHERLNDLRYRLGDVAAR